MSCVKLEHCLHICHFSVIQHYACTAYSYFLTERQNKAATERKECPAAADKTSTLRLPAKGESQVTRNSRGGSIFSYVDGS